ncbi:hypothetical protein GTW63_12250 [Streptomyces sp. SID6137]|nr:hypothetical protein [Streptomyces sp. SID6137]
MTKDVVALTRNMPDPLSVLAALLAGGPDVLAGAEGDGAVVRGVHAQTVREHVRAAEPVLERRLLAGGTDLYEVVLAHLVTGELPVPALGPANRDQADAAVHR